MTYRLALFALALIAAQPASGSELDGTGPEEVDVAAQMRALEQAATVGDPTAQWQLGVALDMGMAGESDPAAAVVWFERAMAQGYPEAHASMALMYALGRGVEVDYEASLNLYLKAASLGTTHGFYGVGVLYANGEGVVQDMQEAMAWLIVAGTDGNEDALMVLNGNSFSTVDPEKAFARANEIAAEFGRPPIKFQYASD